MDWHRIHQLRTLRTHNTSGMVIMYLINTFVSVFIHDVYAALVLYMTLPFEAIMTVCVCVVLSPSHCLKLAG